MYIGNQKNKKKNDKNKKRNGQIKKKIKRINKNDIDSYRIFLN